MHTLRKQDRDNQMDVPVSFHLVPMFRGIAFAIDHIEDHGAKVAIFSADRRVSVLAEHNKQFGTHLKSQAQLIQDYQNGTGNPANPINRTSHCLYADQAVAALMRHNGHPVNVGGRLPWWALGVDLADKGKSEDVSGFLAKARKLGYDFRQPYPDAASEKHHVILVNSPIPRLEQWNVISENRSVA